MGKIISKVTSDYDFFIPFRQHAPSLRNARWEIYADLGRLGDDNGVGFFNILAFRGVFFGSPFAKSDHYQWFESLDDWKEFQARHQKEALRVGNTNDKYYVKKNCYGRTQKDRSLELLESYWTQRKSWKDALDKKKTSTITDFYKWLLSKDGNVSKFYNIGPLTAMLICGDLIEAGLIPMPSSQELGQLIYKVGKGAKDGMLLFGLVEDGVEEEGFCDAFVSLDAYIERMLGDEEKATMGYNVVMLEHTLCKMKRLTTHGISIENILREI